MAVILGQLEIPRPENVASGKDELAITKLLTSPATCMINNRYEPSPKHSEDGRKTAK
jgi:hypothetical protein